MTSTIPTNGQPQQLRIVGIRGLEGRAGKGVGRISLQEDYRQLKCLAFGPQGHNKPLTGTIIYVRIDVALELITECRLTSRQHLKQHDAGNYVESGVWLADDLVILRIVGVNATEHKVLFIVRQNPKSQPVAWSPELGVIRPQPARPPRPTTQPQPANTNPSQGKIRRNEQGRLIPPSEEDITAALGRGVAQVRQRVQQLRGSEKLPGVRLPRFGKSRGQN